MTHDLLPVHPYTGLTALAVLPSGRPVWPIAGGAPDDSDGTDAQDDQDGDTDADVQDDDVDTGDDDDKPLGPAGEKALAAEKERRRAEQTRRRAAEKKLADLEAQLAQARKGTKPPATQDGDGDSGNDKVDAEEIRRQAREEMQAETARERVRDKIEVKARGFADPTDAAALLFQNGHAIEDFLDDGKPDVEAIEDALAALLKKKPYLGATTAQGGRRFQGTADGGAKPVTPARPKSLGEAVSRALAPK